jgi:hypothetical protein
MRIVAATLVTWAALCCVASAQPSADESRDREARSLFEAGRTAFEQGRYENAFDYFQRAYELSPRPAFLYNIGSAADRLRRDEEALEAFEEYLRRAPEAANRAAVQARVTVLQRAIAARQPAEPPPEQPVEPVEPSDDEVSAAATIEPELPGEPDVLPTEPAPVDDGEGASSGMSPIIGIVVAGVGVVAAGLGIAAIADVEGEADGVEAQRETVANECRSGVPSTVCEERRSLVNGNVESINSRWTLGWVGVSVGAALIAGGVVLLVLSGSSDEESLEAGELGCGPTFGGVLCAGRF